jgi:hypothetical protein
MGSSEADREKQKANVNNLIFNGIKIKNKE